MWKGACAGFAAIVLLGIGNARAGDTQEFQKDFQVGPLKISVQGKSGVEVGTVAAAEAGDYWLGVACFPVPEALRSQLGLAEHEGGILIRDVVPESPAAKAGIRRDDVLMKVNGKPLTNPEDLIKVVNAGKDKKLALELIRAGKKVSVSVQPEKRPEHMKGRAEGGWGDSADLQALQGFLDHVMPSEGGPLQFHVFGPGAILPPGAPLYPDLPDKVTVTITKHGREPAKIAVHEGDKKWEITEKELDKLPKDVRSYVDQMFAPASRGMISGRAGMGFGGSWTAAPGPGPGMIRSETRLQKRLDDMSRQIEQMQKSLEQMRQKDTPPAKPQTEKSKGRPALPSDRT